MKRLLVLALGMFFMSGCLVRTYVADQTRTDQDMNGNGGYLLGGQTSNEGRVFKFGKVRKIAVLEVETGSHKPTNKPTTVEAESVENVSEYSTSDSSSAISDSTDSSSSDSSYASTEAPAAEASQEVTFTEYKVEKNDTLQKISQKFFGTTKKWYKIYQENKDVLSSPDKIYPGLVIKVPSK